MTFRNVQVEPAFVSHEKYRKSIQSRQKSLNDCCFSISNVALIVSPIISLIFLVKFLYDDSLYENGEHLLSLRFYRQLVAIIVIMPLVLLIPLFNAISAFFLSSQYKSEMDTTLPGVRLIFEAVLAILVFISIIFVAPYIKHGSVASQLDYEFRRHMKRRYDNDFSEVFLDSIQEEYECCDTPFYLANYPEGTPPSCFRKNGLYNSMYDRTCGDVLASLVSIRCSIIAACLVIILIALASLIGIDLIDCLSYPNQQYNIGSREAQLSPEPGDDDCEETSSLAIHRETSLKLADDCSSLDPLSSRMEQTGNREFERKAPLLATRAQFKPNHKSPGSGKKLESDDDDDDDDDFDIIRCVDKESASNRNYSPTAKVQQTTPILTRASYIYNRAQSPVFVNNSAPNTTQSHNNSSSSLNQTEPKSVLKKCSSFQKVDDYRDDDDDNHDDHDMEEYQKQMQREVQTRRSLLNVRFAE